MTKESKKNSLREGLDLDQTERCGTMEVHWQEVRLDPEYRWRRRHLEAEIATWLKDNDTTVARTGVIRIPVVVHVLWKKNEENISDAQIKSQLTALNQDFRLKNSDAYKTPKPFKKVAADTCIEFALAVRDPNCKATTGITRTKVTKDSWGNNDDMKKKSKGGVDPWDVNKYLNFWVVNHSGNLFGAGIWPGSSRTHGVTCDYKFFGTTGTLDTKGNLGRTMTHEVGHYLDLRHIWGDDQLDADNCSGSDSVADTPNQSVATAFSATPTFPQVSCKNGPNGDMFMNYMDYSADKYMNMFTLGQAKRMEAALHVARAKLLASDGLVPPGGSPGPDLWVQDVAEDIGTEPDPSKKPMYISNDIWVRTTKNGLTNQDHENPEYRQGGKPNYVYVRVRNRGCKGRADGTLKLYWAKASSSLAWPMPWDGSVTKPALMGGLIGSKSVSVDASSSEIVEFAWRPPNPADYASFGANKGHFCLLARIETESKAPYGMTYAETSNLWDNVENNNNIAWKNITVLDEKLGSGRYGQVVATSYISEFDEAWFRFDIPDEEGPTVFDWGEVFVDLPPQLSNQPIKVEGSIQRVDAHTFQILGPGALLGPVVLEAGRMDTLQVRFEPVPHEPMGARVLVLDLVQLRGDEEVGGQRLLLKTWIDLRGFALDEPALVYDGVEDIPCGPCYCR